MMLFYNANNHLRVKNTANKFSAQPTQISTLTLPVLLFFPNHLFWKKESFSLLSTIHLKFISHGGICSFVMSFLKLRHNIYNSEHISQSYNSNRFYVYFCCSVAKPCLTLCDPMDCSMPGFPVLHYLPEFAQIHVH